MTDQTRAQVALLLSSWRLPPREELPNLFAECVAFHDTVIVPPRLLVAYIRHQYSPYEVILHLLPVENYRRTYFRVKLYISARIIQEYRLPIHAVNCVLRKDARRGMDNDYIVSKIGRRLGVQSDE